MERAENEDVAVEHVVERLTDKFPDVPASIVEETVTGIHHSFDDAHVRDFVPVIVEHEAKEKLRDVDLDPTQGPSPD
jgi:hypothetical protein